MSSDPRSTESGGPDHLQQVCRVLDHFAGEASLKRLFWELLSYDRVREPLSTTLLPPSAIALVSKLEIFAESESLTIALAEAERLPAGWQLEQIAWATKRHLSECIVVLNYRKGWTIVYPDEATRPRVRFLPLPGPSYQRVQTARALLALNAAGKSDEELTTLEQSEEIDAFFPGALSNVSDIFDDFDRIARHKNPEVRELRPFLREISAYPLLTARQERGEDLWGRGAPTAEQLQFHRQRLVLHNLRMVVWMAYKVPRIGMTLSDLVQEGSIGLMTAAERFELDRGNRFTTYAFYWIRQAMYRALHNQCNLIRWPVHTASDLMKAAQTREFEGLTAGEKPPLFVPCRLDRAWYYDSDQLSPLIAEEVSRGVQSALQDLRASQKRILEDRFGFGGEEQTLDAIGQEIGVTRERIRQIEAHALRRLRHPARHAKLVPYHELSEWREFSRADEGANGRYRAPLRNFVELREGF